MKTVEFELVGRTYHLLLNGAALFDAYDHFGDKGDLMDHIAGANRDSFENTVWMLVKLCQQGEAWRRYNGEDPQPMLSTEAALLFLGPMDVIRARAAIREAYALGFEREAPSEEEEIDLGLLELQKKTEPALREANGSASRRSFWAFLFGKA